MKFDGHHVASAGDDGALRLTATQSATQRQREKTQQDGYQTRTRQLVDGQVQKHSAGSDQVQSDSVD